MPDEPSRAPQGAEGGSTGASIPFYRDVRVLAVITQIVFPDTLTLVIGWLPTRTRPTPHDRHHRPSPTNTGLNKQDKRKNTHLAATGPTAPTDPSPQAPTEPRPQAPTVH